MIVDSSALIAVLFKEPAYEHVLEKLAESKATGVGAPTLAETGIVLTARIDRDSRGLLGRFLQEFAIITVPFGERHWAQAIEAYERFGQRRHKANLNFGDCMTYATAKLAQQPLLCVGDDFGRTDLDLA